MLRYRNSFVHPQYIIKENLYPSLQRIISLGAPHPALTQLSTFYGWAHCQLEKHLRPSNRSSFFPSSNCVLQLLLQRICRQRQRSSQLKTSFNFHRLSLAIFISISYCAFPAITSARTNRLRQVILALDRYLRHTQDQLIDKVSAHKTYGRDATT